MILFVLGRKVPLPLEDFQESIELLRTQRSDNYTYDPFSFLAVPGRAFWNSQFNFFASTPSPHDPLEPDRGFFWDSNQVEISMYWMAYVSRYLTSEHILEDTQARITKKGFHFNEAII